MHLGMFEGFFPLLFLEIDPAHLQFRPSCLFKFTAVHSKTLSYPNVLSNCPNVRETLLSAALEHIIFNFDLRCAPARIYTQTTHYSIAVQDDVVAEKRRHAQDAYHRTTTHFQPLPCSEHCG